jgi:hypothetical protein
MTVPTIPVEQSMADFARSRGTTMFFVLQTLPDGGMLIEAHDAERGDNTPEDPMRDLVFGARIEFDNTATILEGLLDHTARKAQKIYVVEAVRPVVTAVKIEQGDSTTPTEKQP